MKAGDVIAVEGGIGLVSRAIEHVQKRMGFSKEHVKVTHIAFCINSHGDILEAQAPGIRLWNLAKYDKAGIKYHVLRHKTADPEELTRIAMRLSHNEDFEQREYDFTLLVGLWLVSFQFPLKILNFFNNKNRAICSEFVLEIFKKAGIIKPKEKKLYYPAQWLVWADEGFFTEIFE